MTLGAEPVGGLRRWIPTLFALPALAVLIGFGTWQVQRLHWKQNLIAHQAARLARPPVDVADVPASGMGYAFRRVHASGIFRHGLEMRVAPRTRDGRAGVHVVTPLVLDDGSTVLVNRGWAPAALAAPALRAAGQVAGRLTVTGIVRSGGRPGSFVPDNNPQTGAWHYVDVSAMTRAAGAKLSRRFYVDAGPAPNPGGYPVGGQTRVKLRNDHLQYAVTWYALAVVLLAIYILYLRRRGGGA